jgi:mono/diheme cytochrome c family protein
MPNSTLSRAALAAFLLAGAAPAVRAQPGPAAANANSVANGRKLYLADGCYQCHGVQGQGAGTTGPKLAPQPLALEDFTRQLRHPRDTMPVYTAVVLPDPDLQDIYAYMQSMPKAKTVAEIPLLNH